MPESTGYFSLREVFEKQSILRKLISVRSRDQLAISEAATIQDARDAAMEAKAYLAVKFGSPLIDKIALAMLGPIALDEVMLTAERLPTEGLATEAAKMHHLIAHSIFAAGLEGSDPNLVVGVSDMLKMNNEIRRKHPGAFKLFSSNTNGIVSQYAGVKLFSESESENGTTFKAHIPDYGDDSDEVYRWDVKGETDLVVVAQRGDRRAAIALDIKSSQFSRGSFLTILDPLVTAKHLNGYDAKLKDFLIEQGRGNIVVATLNIASSELSPFRPVELPRKGITLDKINQARQSIRNFGSLPVSDARSIMKTASM